MINKKTISDFLFSKVKYYPEERFENFCLDEKINRIKDDKSKGLIDAVGFAFLSVSTSTFYFYFLVNNGFMLPPYDEAEVYMASMGLAALITAFASGCEYTQYKRNKTYLQSIQKE